MEEKAKSLRSQDLEKMITEAQNMPGIVDLMAVYGNLNELILKSQEYLGIYTPKIISSLSNRSS
jgi:hypothetical protein